MAMDNFEVISMMFPYNELATLEQAREAAASAEAMLGRAQQYVTTDDIRNALLGASSYLKDALNCTCRLLN